jgi:hypothetical protein
MKLIGIVLVILGVVGLAYGGITWTSHSPRLHRQGLSSRILKMADGRG